MRAILSGHPYPRTLFIRTIMRIRVDQEDQHTGRTLEKVSSLRVALLTHKSISKATLPALKNKRDRGERLSNCLLTYRLVSKAYLARMHRWNLIAEDVSVSLDLTTTNSAYRLGRLFSVLDHDRAAARGEMTARSLIVFKHASDLGNAPAHKLLERVKVSRTGGSAPARGFGDYEVTMDGVDLPPGITVGLKI